jgi:hypothetical protein
MTSVAPVVPNDFLFKNSPDTQGIKLNNDDLTKNAKEIVNQLNEQQKLFLRSYRNNFVQLGSRILSNKELMELAEERETLELLFTSLHIETDKAITGINNLSNMRGGRSRNKTNRRRRNKTNRRRNKRHRKSTHRRRHRKY